MQAVVKIGSNQYLVSPGQELLVDRPIIEQVLLVIDGDKVTIGQPEVAQAKVTLKKLADVKGDKIRVSTYKAKSRYRKVKGFRAQYVKVLVENISLGDAPVEAAPRKTAVRQTKKSVKAS